LIDVVVVVSCVRLCYKDARNIQFVSCRIVDYGCVCKIMKFLTSYLESAWKFEYMVLFSLIWAVAWWSCHFNDQCFLRKKRRKSCILNTADFLRKKLGRKKLPQATTQMNVFIYFMRSTMDNPSLLHKYTQITTNNKNKVRRYASFSKTFYFSQD
jgi:hypothetical protein